MMRRVVNLVTRNCYEHVYSVRRMDPYKHFFYQSATEAAAMKEQPVAALQLPPAVMNFAATYCGGTMDMFFALFRPRGTCEGRIVYANGIGGLYNADRNLLNTLGALHEPKGISPMCLSIAPHPGSSQDSMYVLDRFPAKANGRCFEVLEPVTSRRRSSTMPTWRWRLLPPPPFVSQPGYEPSSVTPPFVRQAGYYEPPSSVTAYTAVANGNGCSTIYVSCDGGIGTYRFETARPDPSCRLGWSLSEEWSYVGAWELPFHGRAQHVPEFSLWFGFSDLSPYHLCAMDLSAIDDGECPPTALQVGQDLNPPEEQLWNPIYLELVNLGDGKFLIAKIFEIDATSEQFAVLTGIELMAGVGDDQSIKMVKHKSARFDFGSGNDSIECVF